MLSCFRSLPFVMFFLAILFSSCEKETSFETGGSVPTGGGGSNSGTAKFVIKNVTGGCSDASVNGIYMAAAALTVSNTVEILVTVESIGTYTITTNTANGISFSSTGSFTQTGEQIITMTGTGTPTAAGNYTFTPGTDGCPFNITVIGTITPPVFTGTFTAKVNGTPTLFNVIQATLYRDESLHGKRFDLGGVSSDGQLRIIISLADYTSAAGNGIHTGNYTVRLLQDDDPLTPEDESLDSEDGIYTLSTLIGPESWLTDVYKMTGTTSINSITPGTTTGQVSGTFSGTLTDFTAGTTTYTFTDGAFNNITYYILN